MPEPPIGIEPMPYALREARCLPAQALAAPIARVIALTALTPLGLSGDPVHEPVHAPRPHVLSFCPWMAMWCVRRTSCQPGWAARSCAGGPGSSSWRGGTDGVTVRRVVVSASGEVGELHDLLEDSELVLIARAVDHDHDRRGQPARDDVVKLGPAELDQPLGIRRRQDQVQAAIVAGMDMAHSPPNRSGTAAGRGGWFTKNATAPGTETLVAPARTPGSEWNGGLCGAVPI